MIVVFIKTINIRWPDKERETMGTNGEDSVCIYIYRILDGYALDCLLNRSFEIMSMSFAFYCANKSIVLHYIPRDYGHLFAKKHLFISSVYSILFEVVCYIMCMYPNIYKSTKWSWSYFMDHFHMFNNHIVSSSLNFACSL